MSTLSLQNISKSFGSKKAVQNVSFDIEPGQICGFLGPNGAGKTTTLRMALGLIEPDEGEVKLFGEAPGPKAFGRYGFLPEERGLYKKMPAWASIAHIARLSGMSMGDARKRAVSLLREHGLGDMANQKLKKFSKGMAQKVQLLAAIAHDPEFLILDEPFSGLDPVNQKALEKTIREIAGRGRTILFSTHVMEHAERLCDRIILMYGGEKIFDGAMSEALDLAPRRLIIETDREDIPELLAPLSSGVTLDEVTNLGLRHYIVDLGAGQKPQAILEKCVAAEVRLDRYEPVRASLHEAFVTIVENKQRSAA